MGCDSATLTEGDVASGETVAGAAVGTGALAATFSEGDGDASGTGAPAAAVSLAVSAACGAFGSGPTGSGADFTAEAPCSSASAVREAGAGACATAVAAGRFEPTRIAKRSPSGARAWGSGRDRSRTTRVTGSGAVWNCAIRTRETGPLLTGMTRRLTALRTPGRSITMRGGFSRHEILGREDSVTEKRNRNRIRSRDDANLLQLVGDLRSRRGGRSDDDGSRSFRGRRGRRRCRRRLLGGRGFGRSHGRRGCVQGNREPLSYGLHVVVRTFPVRDRDSRHSLAHLCDRFDFQGGDDRAGRSRRLELLGKVRTRQIDDEKVRSRLVGGVDERGIRGENQSRAVRILAERGVLHVRRNLRRRSVLGRNGRLGGRIGGRMDGSPMPARGASQRRRQHKGHDGDRGRPACHSHRSSRPAGIRLAFRVRA